jgi:hypothetical protein
VDCRSAARLAELAAAGFVEHFVEPAAAAAMEHFVARMGRAPDFDAADFDPAGFEADSEAAVQGDNRQEPAVPERPGPVEEHWQTAAVHSRAAAAEPEAVHCRQAAGPP